MNIEYPWTVTDVNAQKENGKKGGGGAGGGGWK